MVQTTPTEVRGKCG